MKATKQPVRVVAGLHREHGTYYRITIYDNNSIRIERPFCSVATRQEWPTLDEDNAALHYHLINLITPFPHTMTYLIRMLSTEPCWVADTDGDPGRTLVKASAKVFVTEKSAQRALSNLRTNYPNRTFSLEPQSA